MDVDFYWCSEFELMVLMLLDVEIYWKCIIRGCSREGFICDGCIIFFFYKYLYVNNKILLWKLFKCFV